MALGTRPRPAMSTREGVVANLTQQVDQVSRCRHVTVLPDSSQQQLLLEGVLEEDGQKYRRIDGTHLIAELMILSGLRASPDAAISEVGLICQRYRSTVNDNI